MTQNRILRLLALAILCVLPACPAIQTYTDLEAWLAAATPSGVTIDFNSAVCSSDCSALPLSGMTFTSPDGYMGFFTDWGEWGAGGGDRILNALDFGGRLRITMDTPVTAFATQMMVNMVSASSMTVTVKRGEETPLYTSSPALETSGQPTRTFFGIVSTDPLVTFDSILFTPPSGNTKAMLDNVRVGAYQDPTPPPDLDPVPEPGSGFLVFGGATLIALGWLRKRC